jgi:predicted lipoprotein with Yx(FWY)xxD motif
VDAAGMTLYIWAKDVNGMSNASGTVLQTWPVFNTPIASLPASLNMSDFGTITRSDGAAQTTYQGWPLYRFAGDKAAGDTLGDGVGGVWFLVKIPFYSVMLESRTDFGNFLVDPKGMTLYYNNKDSAGTSSVSGNVLAISPIFNPASFILPSTLKAADLGTINREDGKMQATYKGFPLYYYVNDKVSGDANGNGSGGVWFVISIANFPPTPSPTPTPYQGGGGY